MTSANSSEKRKRKRRRAFNRQNGKCHWCGEKMILDETGQSAREKGHSREKHMLCTLEHIDSRYHSERGKHPGEIRVVAAHWICNHNYNRQTEQSLPLQFLQSQAGSRGKPHI